MLFKEEFLLGSIYIPPENSQYSSIDSYTASENELISLLDNDSWYGLFGDFNAKTSDIRYFCSLDENFLEVMEINSDEDILKYFLTIIIWLKIIFLHIDTLNVHVDRMFLVTSSLKCTRKIIYILLIQELVLTSFLEKLLVKMQVLWTRDRIASSNIFDNIASFHIEDINPLFSDVHYELKISSHEFFF